MLENYSIEATRQHFVIDTADAIKYMPAYLNFGQFSYDGSRVLFCLLLPQSHIAFLRALPSCRLLTRESADLLFESEGFWGKVIDY